jgi:hypothetical protein
VLILCNFLALIYTSWFQASYTSPTFEVFLVQINSGVIRPLLYFVSILFNASLGRYIGRSRFFISVFKEYHIIAGDFVEVNEAEKMLHTLTVKLPLIITMFLWIIPFIIFSSLSDKMFFGPLADKKKLSLNITAFMFLDALFLFYATYIIGVWLWLCFITKKMNQQVVENIDGDQLKLKNSLVCFMASIEKMKDFTTPWRYYMTALIIVILYVSTYQLGTAVSLVQIADYYPLFFCDCLDPPSICPDTGLDTNPSNNGNTPTSMPTGIPTSGETNYFCEYYDDGYYDQQLGVVYMAIFIFGLQAIVSFLIAFALVALPAYIGDGYSTNFKGKLVSFVLFPDPLVQTEAVVAIQVREIYLNATSLLVCGSHVSMEKISFLFSIVGALIANASNKQA